MDVRIADDWKALLADEFDKPYFRSLVEFVRSEYASTTIYPKGGNIFRAFDKCPVDKLKVVIIGQDPYHGEGQAHGLAFSVQPGVQPPPSLVNMFKEINAEYGTKLGKNGCLLSWAKQGVLLLNTALTVRAGQANSHKNKGWEIFTDAVIKKINEREKPVVFLLWGGNAKQKTALITNSQHKILTSVHPSPLSAYGGFFGCGHFKLANEFLESIGDVPIDWSLE